VTLPRQWEKHALALIEAASPLTGEFFRSIEIAYAHPDDVVSGRDDRDQSKGREDPAVRGDGAVALAALASRTGVSHCVESE
jgi:hypothetical protein